MSSTLFSKIFGNNTSAGSTPQPDFSQYANWLQWRAGRFTAGPPQLLSQYGIQLGDPNARFAALPIAFTEITGIPTLTRWWQAILQNKPISQVEKDYYERLAKELGVDPEELKKRAEQATMHASLVALPLATPFSKAEAAHLARALGIGFGLVGGPTAIIRAEQGYKEEAPKAFIEAGLAGTVLADITSTLKGLATNITPDRFNIIKQQVMQKRGASPWRDPEGEAFINQINDALLSLKRGDTSRYDALVKQFEEWQKTISEFNKLYELRQKGQLSPEDESRYTKLLQEVAKIRDKYDILKSYIEATRETGLEARGRQLEFESRTISDLANAAKEAGPPVKDILQRLNEMDLDRLLRLTKDPEALSRFARRFGIDEQVLAEQATAVLRGRQWENLANMPNEELRKILMDESLLKKYASELGVEELKLRERLEELLQQRMGLAPPKTPPERPPIEPIRTETQFRSPEVETEGGRGQVLIAKTEELKPTVRRLEELPTVEARLKTLMQRRRRLVKEGEPLQRLRDAAEELERTRQPASRGEQRVDQTAGNKTSVEKDRTADTNTSTIDRTTAGTSTTERTAVTSVSDRTVVTERELVRFVPYLPPTLLTMPVAYALPMVAQIISSVVGVPVTLRLPPPPSGDMPLGAYLRSILPRVGLGGAQREVYVLL
jgi:hypothetical protein